MICHRWALSQTSDPCHATGFASQRFSRDCVAVLTNGCSFARTLNHCTMHLHIWYLLECSSAFQRNTKEQLNEHISLNRQITCASNLTHSLAILSLDCHCREYQIFELMAVSHLRLVTLILTWRFARRILYIRACMCSWQVQAQWLVCQRIYCGFQKELLKVAMQDRGVGYLDREVHYRTPT